MSRRHRAINQIFPYLVIIAAPDCRLPAKMSVSLHGRTTDDQGSKNSSASPLDGETFPAQSLANVDAGISNKGFDPGLCEEEQDKDK
jgi:hypothetical protein